MDKDTSVKVAVRIRPLSVEENVHEPVLCLDTIDEESQIVAGNDTYFTFDYVFGVETQQERIYHDCVTDLVDAFFEGFNATILAYGQTGSGKTWTMGSSSDMNMSLHTIGIIPRVIKNLFEQVRQKEEADPTSTYKIHVQFLEIYGEDIRDLLDQTKSSNVTIRETREDGVFVSGAREELVSSYEQMMKSLEDGTRHRTTASTRMNQTSSRSHAIFTVILEHTIWDSSVIESAQEGVPPEMVRAVTHQEVRRSKFHFVDLAGSERAKRTGAQGHQLKEGIDINKGLLALGNVISALGDDTKRGKAFVPYRDSKLTRMLQDSLGGNSKTLMICCVSPSSLNFNESVNALRYANRARNIKNKPVVNRDPTLVMIDEMKHFLQKISSELLEIRKAKQYVETDDPVPLDVLESWAQATTNNGAIPVGISSTAVSAACSIRNSPMTSSSMTLSMRSSVLNHELPSPTPMPNNTFGQYSGSRETPPTAAIPPLSPLHKQDRNNNKEIAQLRSRVRDSDYEVQRLTSQLKKLRLQMSEAEESLILASSERDFYKMKWADASPNDAAKMGNLDSGEAPTPNSPPSSDRAEAIEKKKVMDIMGNHLREIDSLKKQLAEEKSKNATAMANLGSGIFGENSMDEEFTTSITTLLDQTRAQLQNESRRLKGIGHSNQNNNNSSNNSNSSSAGGNNNMNNIMSESDELNSDEEQHLGNENAKSLAEMEDEQKAYLKRQKLLTTEVEELGQSILLKEQLMAQLTRSQQQYGAMKAFYEQKLTVLSIEMTQKQEERDRLLIELQEVSGEKNEAIVQKEVKEKTLREHLKRKDEELRTMKTKQDELSRLSQMQTRYSSQLTKLEMDITSMKKQRVDLTKTLNSEKKNHLIALTDKAKEIDRLKRELIKSTNEVKKLGRDKELAETKAKDALREGFVLKKKTQELLKVQPNLVATRTAYKAINKISRMNSNLSGNKRILTEEELRTKRWIDKRIEEISAREAAAEALKAQYEHQLELLNRKETLENERNIALEKKERISNEIIIKKERMNAIDSSVMLSEDEHDILLEIEDQLLTIDGELDERHLQISSIAQQIASSGDVAGSDKTMEVLKRTAAGSLPAAHELIRLLFDMLVQSSRTIQIRWEEIQEYREREENLKSDIDELVDQIAIEKRAHDMELTQSANEYEEKLQDLFEQIAVSNYKLFEKDHHITTTTTDTTNSTTTITNNDTNTNTGNAEDIVDLTDLTNNQELAKIEPVRLQLAVSTEECKFLRSQLGRESSRYTQILSKYNDIEKNKLRLIREIRDKTDQIKFLEEDRSLFKTLADDLKTGLQSLGKPGKTILDTIKDRHSNKNKIMKRGLFAEYTSLSDHEEDDTTESVLGEFEFLAEEIARTGGITSVPEKTTVASNVSNSNISSSNVSTGSNTPSRSIYDRLTNPSNFTGHMKNVFENDLELKRKKIQQIKEKSNPGGAKRDSGSYRSAASTTTSGIGGSSNSSGTGETPRRNPETQKFFNEYYDRNNTSTPTGTTPIINTDLEDSADVLPLPPNNSDATTAGTTNAGGVRSTSTERREASPSVKRMSNGSYPPRPPPVPGALNSPQAVPEWSISADPWR